MINMTIGGNCGLRTVGKNAVAVYRRTQPSIAKPSTRKVFFQPGRSLLGLPAKR